MIPFNKFEDYYAKLEVKDSASDADLREAFRKMSLKLHPDKHRAKPEEERVVSYAMSIRPRVPRAAAEAAVEVEWAVGA